MDRTARRGLALLIVVAILGVMTVLATCFVTVARLERRASQQRLNGTKAFLLARSGLEDALARIHAGQDPDFAVSRFRGADRDANGMISVPEGAFYPRGVGDPDPPARKALRPTWAALMPGTPTAALAGWGYSGRMDAGAGSQYSLKTSGEGFYVNGGDPQAGPEEGYNAVLRRILGTLAEALDRVDGDDDAFPADEPDGWALIDARPASGWRSLEEITATLRWNSARTAALRPYLLFQAWTDKRVIAPNVPDELRDQLLEGNWKDYASWGELRLERSNSSADSKAPGFERIRGRNVGRAPVSLAWAARHPPALIALLSWLYAVYLEEEPFTDGSTWHVGARPHYVCGMTDSAVGSLWWAQLENRWNATDDCHLAAGVLQAGGAQVSTWQEFEALVDTIPFPLEHTDTQIQAKRDLIKANFNPNSNLNKFNPDRSVWRTVDKSDLMAYSTEFSLSPLQPVVLESCGRILGPRGEFLAERTLKATASPGVLRLSTQKEFVCESLGNLDFPGDETSIRLPGHPRFVSESRGDSRTWGHRLDARGTDPSSYLNGISQGASVQSYPEACYGDPGLRMRPADFDGRIAPATLETPDGTYYAVNAPARRMMMLGRFDDGFDLDFARGSSQCLAPWNSPSRPPGDNNLQLVGREDGWYELANGVWHASKPSTLYPDGAYSEEQRAVGWLDRGNAHGFHGLMSFWVKNSFSFVGKFTPDFEDDPYSRARGRNYVHWTAFGSGSGHPYDDSQFFFIGECNRDGIPNVCAHFQIGRVAMRDHEIEHQFRTASTDPAPHRWRLVTLFWDFRSPTRDDSGRMILDTADIASEDLYHPESPVAADLAEDITRDDGDGPHAIILGCMNEMDATMLMCCGGGADATFDEFAIWDFGGSIPVADPADPTSFEDFAPGSIPEDLASARWQEGRYYLGSAYTSIDAPAVDDQAPSWLSGPVRLPAGSRILRVEWTFRKANDLPELSGDFAEISLANEIGDGYAGTASASRSTSAAGWTSAVQRWNAAVLLKASFRLQAVFRRVNALPDGTPLLDAPSLDDLTVVWIPPAGPRLLEWKPE